MRANIQISNEKCCLNSHLTNPWTEKCWTVKVGEVGLISVFSLHDTNCDKINFKVNFNALYYFANCLSIVDHNGKLQISWGGKL